MGNGSALLQNPLISVKSHVRQTCGMWTKEACHVLTPQHGEGPSAPLPQYPEASSNTAQSVLKPGLGLVRSSLAL